MAGREKRMTGKIKRRTAITAAAAALAARATPGLADDSTLLTAAKAEGTLTWYSAQLDAAVSEEVGRTFTNSHPGVNVGVIRTTGQVAYQRLMMDIKNHTPSCDVFSATDISHLPILKERGEVAEYTPANAGALLPPFRAVSDPGFSYVTNASRYFII
jgi:iron(III) transport system substrate-binding protein